MAPIVNLGAAARRGRMTTMISHTLKLRTAAAIYFAHTDPTDLPGTKLGFITKKLFLRSGRRQLSRELFATGEEHHEQRRRYTYEMVATRRNEDRQFCASQRRGIQQTMGNHTSPSSQRYHRSEFFLTVPDRQGLHLLSEMMRREHRQLGLMDPMEKKQKMRAFEQLADIKSSVNSTLHSLIRLSSDKDEFEKEADKLVETLKENKKYYVRFGSLTQAIEWDWDAFRALHKYLQTGAEQGNIHDEWSQYRVCLEEVGNYISLGLEDHASVSAKTIGMFNFTQKTEPMDEADDDTCGTNPFGRGLEKYDVSWYNTSIPCMTWSTASTRLTTNLDQQSPPNAFAIPSPGDFQSIGHLINTLNSKSYKDVCDKEAHALFSHLNDERAPGLECFEYLGAGLSWLLQNQNQIRFNASQITSAAAGWASGIEKLRLRLFNSAWKPMTGAEPLLGFRKDLRKVTDLLGLTIKVDRQLPQVSTSLPVPEVPKHYGDIEMNDADDTESTSTAAPGSNGSAAQGNASSASTPTANNMTGQTTHVAATTARVSGGSGFAPGLLATGGRGFGGPSAFARMNAQLGASHSATMFNPSHATLSEVKNGTGSFASTNIKNTADLLAMFNHPQQKRLINQERLNVLSNVRNAGSTVHSCNIVLLQRACNIVIQSAGDAGYDWTAIGANTEVHALLLQLVSLRNEIDDAKYNRNDVAAQPILKLATDLTKACTMMMNSEQDLRAGINMFDPANIEDRYDIAQISKENPRYDAILQQEINTLKQVIATSGVVTFQDTALLRLSCEYILTPSQQDWFDPSRILRICRNWWNVMFQLGVDLHPLASSDSEINNLYQDLLKVHSIFNPGPSVSP